MARIPLKTWKSYIARLRRVSNTAAQKMTEYLSGHDTGTDEGLKDVLDYAYALATKYGEGAAALSAEMYDAMARLSGVKVPPAELAATADYGEVAKTVQGIMKWSKLPESVGSGVGRLVKTAGVDTTMQNALRDGAQWAWIPSGDSCAFCLMLASNGWQNASKKALRNGHAEHIHNNCDCTYAVRFDNKTTVAGYDPASIKAQFDATEGDTWEEKVKNMRREHDAAKRGVSESDDGGILESHKAASHELFADSAKLVQGYHTDKSFVEQKFGMRIQNVTSEYLNYARPNIGTVDYENGFVKRLYPDEIRVAKWIHETFGGDIILLTEKYVERPDYEWNGKLWDLKTPEKENSIGKRIQKGLSQIFDNPGGIIVDKQKLDISTERLEQIITGRMKTSLKHQVDIMIIDGDKLVKIIRYNKN